MANCPLLEHWRRGTVLSILALDSEICTWEERQTTDDGSRSLYILANV